MIAVDRFRTRRFEMIERLVAVAVVRIRIALLHPALQSAREAARSTTIGGAS